MKIDTKRIDGDNVKCIQEIYCNTVLETSEGNRLAVCMRDDTIEMNFVKDGQVWWHQLNVKTGAITPMTKEPQITKESDNGTDTENKK